MARTAMAAALVLAIAGLLRGSWAAGEWLAGAATSVPGAVTSVLMSGDDEAAVKRVIQRANEAQQRAFAGRDPSLMRETSTAAHYEEMVRINEALAAEGVRGIELLRITFGDLSVNGNTATAATLETWRSSYADGRSDESTDENAYVLVREGGAWKIDQNTQPDTRTLAPAPAAARRPTVVETSSNWSGYAATGGTYTSVTGTWNVPEVSTATAGADATWVGIGGVSTRDLIQAGTQATVSGSRVVYTAWIEMLPASAQTVSLAVNAGDSVTVAIGERGSDQWSIAIKNNTTGRSYATSVSYASSRSSVEWIEEAPSAGRRIVPLADFGSIRFTGASAVKDGVTVSVAGSGARPVTMIDGAGRPIAVPSTLAADGAGFTVVREHPPGGAAPRTGRRGRGSL